MNGNPPKQKVSSGPGSDAVEAKLLDAMYLGDQIEFEPEEAALAGAFEEDAMSLSDAESAIDFSRGQEV